MATANVSNSSHKGGKAAAGRPDPQTAAPQKPPAKPGGKQGKGGRKKNK